MLIDNPPLPQSITLADLKQMPLPRAVLMCPPEWFDVLDVKNPFMEGQKGHVDIALAKQQWAEVVRAFHGIGVDVRTLPPLPGCEDMVFCANPIFAGVDSKGQRTCVLSHMRFATRKPEVSAHANWFRANEYRVVPIDEPGLFEGSGDALWHPGRRLIWGGYGQRTSKEIYGVISEIFDAPVLPLELVTECFYHLDTCFCPLDEKTALVYPRALSRQSLEQIRRVFHCVIEVNEYEATHLMACNAAAFFGKYVVIQQGAEVVNRRLREHGFQVIEVDTSEFMKSGGSVFCMKMYLF